MSKIHVIRLIEKSKQTARTNVFLLELANTMAFDERGLVNTTMDYQQ